MSQKTNKERQIFADAVELPAERRAAFLKEACATDDELLKRVQELLDAYSDESPVLRTVCDALPGVQKIPEGPGTRIGRYQLLQRIGEGGMGVVYMAEQTEPVRRRVALKIIKLGMDTRQVVARFEAERQALALMDHPNIARVLDGGATDTGRPFFVMELVQGVPITEFCATHKLPAAGRLKLFVQVCQAVESAHQKGIIHRDLKPSNVLVMIHDGEPMPKVIDFGIAKATNQKLTEKTLFTHHATMIGTPAYMSPEQAAMSPAAAGDVDTRTDVYALGVLLYELLTGTTPFPEKRLRSLGYGEMRRVIMEEEAERPSMRLSTMGPEERTAVAGHHGEELAELNSRLQGDIDWIVMKCLEKDRTRRYATANGLAADIQRHLANEPVVARPPSTAYQLQKAWRRNKVVFTAGAVVAVALVAGLGVSSWQAVLATRAQAKAEKEQQRADFQARAASESEQRSRRLLYASDMNLAQQSLRQNNLGRARRLLDRHRPKRGEEDLRGWEWRYLWRLTRGNGPVTLTNRPTQGFSVSFSPDGIKLAVGWWDGRVDLWDIPGRRWARALTDHELPHPARVAFSPVRNLLAATSGPSAVTLYDLDSGGESILWQVTDPGGWDVRDLTFSQDGSKVVIYAGSNPDASDAVWVVNVSSSQIESRDPTGRSWKGWPHIGAARLSPDNRRLYRVRSDYLNGQSSIRCIDLGTNQELWRTPPERGRGLTTLDISPDGRVLASASGFIDTTIHLWDTATGELIKPLAGHTASVIDLAFTRDGRRLMSAAMDQTIRFWDTSTWTETHVLRGHTDEAWAIAISEAAQLIATTGKDGSLLLWRMDEKGAADGYRSLEEGRGIDDVQPLDHSRVLLVPPGQPPELVDLKRDSPLASLREIGSSANVLGCFGSNILCHWDGTNQIVVRELDGTEFVQRGTISLNSAFRPSGFAYNPARRLLAWSEGTSSRLLYLASLGSAGHRIELTNDVPGLVPFRFSEDGKYLAAARDPDTLRAWNVETRQIVASVNQTSSEAWRTAGFRVASCFAADGSVLAVSILHRIRNQVGFYNLDRPDQGPRRVSGGFVEQRLAVSPNGELVAASSFDGQVLLFDAVKGELIDSFHRHLNSVSGIAFSPDGRRLVSTMKGQEAVKLWDVGTRQELLTLAGADQWVDKARWSADGDVILAGAPWQSWRAPSWEEIKAVEAKEPHSSELGGQGRAENQQP